MTGALIQAKLHSQGADTDPLVRCHAPLAFGSIDTVARRIENEKGAWHGSFTNIKYPDSTTIVSDRARGRGCLQGADGPVGVDKSQAVGVRLGCPGLIIEGEVPVAPEPYLGQ